MTTTTREAPHHDNLTCVKQYRCRRPECLDRERSYETRRRRHIGYGTWQPYTDAQPVRDHIDMLRTAGATIPGITEAANVANATIARILYGERGRNPATKMRTEAAAKILAVRPEDCPVADGVRIDATGTRRRLQALVAMGWPFTALGPEFGLHPRPFTDLARATTCTAGTARKIATGYRRLATTPPGDRGIPAPVQALARRVAARNNWVSPAAWDNIDDPNEKPEACPPPGLPTQAKRAAVRNIEIRHLAACGESEEQIAIRLGLDVKDVRGRLAKWRREAALTQSDTEQAA